MTEDDMLGIKRDIKYLKDVVIKDILYVMLSNSEDVKQLTSSSTTSSNSNCEDDGECFDKAYRLCKPITFEPDPEVIINIQGLEGDNCILKAKFKEGRGPTGGPYDMTCKIKNYALGMTGPEDILPFCEGSMVEIVKQSEGGEGPGVPGKCSGDQCKDYCGRGSTEAKECLEHLGKYLPPEAKRNLESLVNGRGNFGSQDFGQFQQQSYSPQSTIRPEQCDFTDMSNDECVDYLIKVKGSPPECEGLTDAQCRKYMIRKWENQKQFQPQQSYGGPQQFNQPVQQYSQEHSRQPIGQEGFAQPFPNQGFDQRFDQFGGLQGGLQQEVYQDVQQTTAEDVSVEGRVV